MLVQRLAILLYSRTHRRTSYKDRITFNLIFKLFSVYLLLNVLLVNFILKCFQDKDKQEDLERGEVIYVLEVRIHQYLD